MSQPWMKFYPGDYLRDTADLSTVEHGAYMLLIMHYWTSGGIPSEDDRLARIVRLSSSEWVAIARRVLGFFSSIDGEWAHGRIDEELSKANAKREKLVESGSAGGKAKAKAMANAIANATANALATPEPEPEPEDKKKETRDASAREFALEVAGQFTTFWEAYPHKVGKPDAAKSFLRERRNGAEASAIFEGLNRYIAGKPADRPWLNPATFLNQQRWEDQPALGGHSGSNRQERHSLSAAFDKLDAALDEQIARERGEVEAGDIPFPPNLRVISG